MATSDLLKALIGARVSPSDTGYGFASGAIGHMTGPAISPYASSSQNLGIGAGSVLLQGLLNGFAKKQAQEENAQMYAAFRNLTAAPDLASQDAIVKQNPALSPIAMMMQAERADAEAAGKAKALSRADYMKQAALGPILKEAFTETPIKDRPNFINNILNADTVSAALAANSAAPTPAFAATPTEVEQPFSINKDARIAPPAEDIIAEPAAQSALGAEVPTPTPVKDYSNLSPSQAKAAMEADATMARKQAEIQSRERSEKLKLSEERRKELEKVTTPIFELANETEMLAAGLETAMAEIGPGRTGPLGRIVRGVDTAQSVLGEQFDFETPEANKKVGAATALNRLGGEDTLNRLKAIGGNDSNRDVQFAANMAVQLWKSKASNEAIVKSIRNVSALKRFEANFLQRAAEVGKTMGEAKRAFSNYTRPGTGFPGIDKKGNLIPEHLPDDLSSADKLFFDNLLGGK